MFVKADHGDGNLDWCGYCDSREVGGCYQGLLLCKSEGGLIQTRRHRMMRQFFFSVTLYKNLTRHVCYIY